MAYARRTDSTHAAIVKALRKVGCKVKDTSRLPKFVDLVVRVPPNPDWKLLTFDDSPHTNWVVGRITGADIVLMEVKGPKGELTADQEAFIADFPETVVVHSVEEALKAIGLAALGVKG